MSISQTIWIYAGCFMLGLMLPTPKNFKEFLSGLVVVCLASLAWSMGWCQFFKSDYYHNLEKAVGFNLGF
jgi:hypothetical protein